MTPRRAPGAQLRRRLKQAVKDRAKKPMECLEYIAVHEMAHLIEPTHPRRFITLMNCFMPKWQFYPEALNRLPVRHEEWGY